MSLWDPLKISCVDEDREASVRRLVECEDYMLFTRERDSDRYIMDRSTKGIDRTEIQRLLLCFVIRDVVQQMQEDET